jgi:hypothetical protein
MPQPLNRQISLSDTPHYHYESRCAHLSYRSSCVVRQRRCR